MGCDEVAAVVEAPVDGIVFEEEEAAVEVLVPAAKVSVLAMVTPLTS